MIHLQRLLLPTDFSDYARAAVDYACTLAEKFHAELHLVHVLETHISTIPQMSMAFAMPQYSEEARQAADKTLHEYLDAEWVKNQHVLHAVLKGEPFLEIIRYAREKDIDMIVLATHGRTGLAHVLMGSVAEKVVRMAPCPVLTVRPEEHAFEMP